MTVTLSPRPRSGRRYVTVPTGAARVAAPAPPPSPPTGGVPAAPGVRRRRPGVAVTLGLTVVLPLAALSLGLALGVVLGLLVVGQRAAVGVTTLPQPGPTATAAAPALGAAFPDVDALGAACAPYDPGARGYTTSTGARALAVIRCDHGAAVPGGWVYYTQWPSAADARQWQADQVRWGPSVDGRARWDVAGQDQGAWHTRAEADGTVYATAAYADRPYAFDVVTRSAQDTARVFAVMRLLPTGAVPA